MQTTTQI